MTPRQRKVALTLHVATSVGWLGAAVAYLALAISGLRGQDVQLVRSAYVALEVLGWRAIVPLSVAAVVTGLVQALGTPWGLLRHTWVLAKLVLTIAAALVLLTHMPNVSRMAALAADPGFALGDAGALRGQLVVHAGGGVAVLLVITALSVFKPWGRTPWQQKRRESAASAPQEAPAPRPAGQYVVAALVALVTLIAVLHLLGGGPPRH